MCGIAGRILDEPGPVGVDLVELMQAQRHRGADSTGFALYGSPLETGYRVVVFLEDRSQATDVIDRFEQVLKRHGAEFIERPTLNDAATQHGALRFTVSEPDSPIEVWTNECDGIAGTEILSVGRSLEIVKDDGDAYQVADRHGVRDFIGTHGLGHARLATESSVSPIASHPFWARPFPDVAIVHNGQLTNYYLWRRRLEHHGYRFATENDSELIAVWLSDQMKSGASLSESLTASVTALDGVFTFLLSTADEIGMAKDRLAIKPIVAVETDGATAMATEEQAIRHLYGVEAKPINLDGPGTVRVWPIKTGVGV
ncbi:MAG: class II glutamine amidotransferase [Acidimicrobiia bacterium]|nr:class II glutamine amidotransferase [Acidimicrobiia bacterium]